MVVLVDLDDDDDDASPGPPLHTITDVKPVHHSLAPHNGPPMVVADERPNPNVNGFSAALSCYPIVRQLASQLDLNTLHDLSRTCRQFRANLLEYRAQLVRHTLHCCNEVNHEVNHDINHDINPKHGSTPTFTSTSTSTPRLDRDLPSPSPCRRLTSGRVAQCARDMVGECQRCGYVVCRNCTMKPPATPVLRARHRRLCRTCNKSPLPLLLSSASPSPSASPPFQPCFFPRAFTAPAFERTPCNCDNVVWLCAPCGKDLRNADTMYVRGWSWRTRYSHYLGGVGTGAGEGNEGVECGRASACLGARVVEHETCEQDILDALAAADASPDAADRWRGSSYLAQEIEGIGGVLKVKHKKQVRIGECVKLYEDEREKAVHYLEREVTGKLRSWCSWCERIVLGDKDRAELAGIRPTSRASSSASSSMSRS